MTLRAGILWGCRVLLAQRVCRAIGLAAAIGAILQIAVGSPAAVGPTIRSVKGADGRIVAFEALKLPPGTLAALADLPADDGKFSRLLSVRVADEAGTPEQPAMLGRYSIDDSTLRFTPRYPLRPGLKYRVTLRPSALEPGTRSDETKPADPIVLEVTVPDLNSRPAEVAQVYPTAPILPENQLRFYLHFSQPMSRGEAYEHLSLLKADGRAVDLPFLEIGEELWDASGQRLTLLIDPGRIKRGVKPLEDLGPALEAGQTFTLVVNAGWKDAAGRPLKQEFRKQFKVAPPLRNAIDSAKWKTTAPRYGTNDPLTIHFGRTLDHGLLEHTLLVTDPAGRRCAGRVTIADEERRWEFRPEKPWASGLHQVVVDTSLEDTAGNRIGVPFEADVAGTISKRALPETVQIPFTVANGKD
ncbi:MAG TPA: hypothetical protein VL475_10750 [Planctomycetaceae bacterium]|nr:hypothetical protein [Planctomycetaceae bacterium]